MTPLGAVLSVVGEWMDIVVEVLPLAYGMRSELGQSGLSAALDWATAMQRVADFLERRPVGYAMWVGFREAE